MRAPHCHLWPSGAKHQVPKNLSTSVFVLKHQYLIYNSDRYRCETPDSGYVPFVPHLVRVHQPGVWEVERGDEQTHALALHPVPVQVIGDDPGHEVLASSRPAVEGERQRLVGLWVVDETLNGFEDHRLNQVLPMELRL